MQLRAIYFIGQTYPKAYHNDEAPFDTRIGIR